MFHKTLKTMVMKKIIIFILETQLTINNLLTNNNQSTPNINNKKMWKTNNGQIRNKEAKKINPIKTKIIKIVKVVDIINLNKITNIRNNNNH